MGMNAQLRGSWATLRSAAQAPAGPTCATHADSRAVARCLTCAAALCDACHVTIEGRDYCAAHGREARALHPVAWSRDDLADAWTRAIAAGIDVTAILIGWAAVCLVVLWLVPAAAVNWFCTFAGISLGLLAVAYFTLLVGRYGQTIGQGMLGLQVLGADGLPVSYGRALVRCLGGALGVATAFTGFLLAAYDGDKQGLHDKLAGTVVLGASLPAATKVRGSLVLMLVMGATVAALTPLLSLAC
jgi:uncharacterized RDD family membrane protein YckC